MSDETEDDDKNVLDDSLENKPNDPTAKEPEQADPPTDKKPDAGDKQDDTTDDDVVWPDTGSDIGNEVVAYLKETGVTPEQAKALLWDSAQSGDYSKIDKAALVAAVGEAGANIVLAGMKSFIGEFQAKKAAAAESIYTAVGGEQNWNKLRDWARANLSKEELQDYVSLIDKGGRFVNVAIKDMTERYVEAGNTGFEKGEVVPKQQGKTTDVVKPLSRREYFEELDKLNRVGKLTPEKQRELRNRRMASK